MRIRQSFCYPMYMKPEMSFDALFAAAAEIGYEAVEGWGRGEDFEQVVEAAHRHGLVVASFIASGSCPAGFNDPAAHAELEDQTKASIDFAAAHGVPGMIVFSGNRRDGVSDDEGIALTAEGLSRVAPYAEEKGVTLNLELLNSKRDHVGYQCDHTAWAVAVCQEVGSSRVRVLYDIYHMQIMEGDVIATIRDSIDWIGHFHTAGNPGRKDMDDAQELNYAGICKAIAQTGYTGFVGHEFGPKGDPVAALRRAFEICDQS